MKFNRSYSVFSIAIALLLVGLIVSPGLSQSRRQPPTSNEKKNKRPGETPKQDEQQEPLPPDIVPTKPQDLEKVTISTQIVNVDATIIAQAPRMAPHIAAMTRNIAADLDVAPEAVNVKATTTESLGFTGRGEGIAAQAVVLID